jgi:hypothetical protein
MMAALPAIAAKRLQIQLPDMKLSWSFSPIRYIGLDITAKVRRPEIE